MKKSTEDAPMREEEEGEGRTTASAASKKRPLNGTVPLVTSSRLINSCNTKFKDEPMCENTTSMKKRSKLCSKELDRKLKEGNEQVLGGGETESWRKPLSDREFRKLLEEARKPAKEEGQRREPHNSTYLKPEEFAKLALSEYNKKHETSLEYVSFLHDRIKSSYSLGLCIDFAEKRSMWTHFNFEARRHNADPRDKPLLLFAEVYSTVKGHRLTTLSLVKDSHDTSGCQFCFSKIRHPPHGFRAGFDLEGAVSNPELLSKEVAGKLSKFALEEYNRKNGTKLKLRKALGCYRFTCDGLLMDFTEKNTSWVHMNFLASIGGPKEKKVLLLFGELYQADDDKYVLATLSATMPSTVPSRVKKDIVIRCGCCPPDIQHPWRGYRYCFNYQPSRNIPHPTLA